MKEEWTDKLRRKLDGHKMTPPAGLWEGISKEMGLEPAPVPKASIIRKCYWVAAAVVLALVGFFAFYDFDDVEPKLETNNEMPIKVSTLEKLKTTDVPTIPKEPAISMKSKAPHAPMTQNKPSLLVMATPVEPRQQDAIVETQQITIKETNENEQASVENKTEAKTETLHQKQTYLPDVIEPVTTASYSEGSSRWTIGLAGSNGLLLAANNYVNTVNSQPLYYDASSAQNKGYSYEALTNSKDALPYTLADIESKHHIPVRFGLSLQYQLNNRLALLSGINYTYLKSEFSIPLYNKGYDQKLSYLGIPLALSWKIWSTEHFNVYLVGGTMIEKCVSAEMTDSEIKPRPWQWSVNASVGAEYYITRQIGFYLEPSLGYYFDDGTKLEHYYKEHPLAPSLQFGLRLYLK